jgi:hypothetical protein
MNFVIISALVALGLLLFSKYQRDAKHKLLARSTVFDDCIGLLQNAQTSQDKANLQVLHGNYSSYKISLNIVEDTIGWRKLPPLWLLVKVIVNKPNQGSLDLIVRPANNEFYSPSWQWDGNLTIPPNWPQHAIIKYLHKPIDISLLEHIVPTLFSDLKMKELLIMPEFVRLTYMVKQADRGEYLIMRNAVYNDAPIVCDIAEGLIKQAITICQALESKQ